MRVYLSFWGCLPPEEGGFTLEEAPPFDVTEAFAAGDVWEPVYRAEVPDTPQGKRDFLRAVRGRLPLRGEWAVCEAFVPGPAGVVRRAAVDVGGRSGRARFPLEPGTALGLGRFTAPGWQPVGRDFIAVGRTQRLLGLYQRGGRLHADAAAPAAPGRGKTSYARQPTNRAELLSRPDPWRSIPSLEALELDGASVPFGGMGMRTCGPHWRLEHPQEPYPLWKVQFYRQAGLLPAQWEGETLDLMEGDSHARAGGLLLPARRVTLRFRGRRVERALQLPFQMPIGEGQPRTLRFPAPVDGAERSVTVKRIETLDLWVNPLYRAHPSEGLLPRGTVMAVVAYECSDRNLFLEFYQEDYLNSAPVHRSSSSGLLIGSDGEERYCAVGAVRPGEKGPLRLELFSVSQQVEEPPVTMELGTTQTGEDLRDGD